MRNLKIFGRLAVGFASIFVLLALTILVVSIRVAAGRELAAEVAEIHAPTAMMALKLTAATTASANATRGFIINRNPAFRTEWGKNWATIDGVIDAIEGPASHFQRPENRAAWREEGYPATLETGSVRHHRGERRGGFRGLGPGHAQSWTGPLQ
jgi:hypothetical protein